MPHIRNLRSRGPFVRGSRRETTWRAVPVTVTNLAASGGTILNSLDSVELQKRPFTIVRTHLECYIVSDQLIADEIQLGAIGMAVVSSQSEAVGVTAVPTPMTDIESDLWMVHQFMWNNFSFITAAGFQGKAGTRYTIDSKAQRKVADDQDVVIVAEANVALGDGFNLFCAGRVLIKEH